MRGRAGPRVPWLALAGLAASVLLAGPSAATPVHFLVAELPGTATHGDSYVLSLEDPAAIAHARALIAQGPAAGATIALATIAMGADGVNRDWLAPGRPEWSWHVVAFLGFADIAAEIFDGWPGFVESDVAGWIQNTGGTIGFWQYTVVAELPEPSPVAAIGLGLALILGASLRHRPRLRGTTVGASALSPMCRSQGPAEERGGCGGSGCSRPKARRRAGGRGPRHGERGRGALARRRAQRRGLRPP